MREITVSAYNAIEAERNNLQEEMVGLRRRNAELEKEARRAATLERELEREQRLHAQRKERHQAAVAETGRLDQQAREQTSYIRSLEEQVEDLEARLQAANGAHTQLEEARREIEVLEQKVAHHEHAEQIRLEEIKRLREIETAHNTLKGILR